MDKRRKVTKEKKILLSGVMFLAVGGALLLAARTAEGFADWYSSHIYTVFVNVIGRLMGQFPFSVSEILLYVLLGCVLWWIGCVLLFGVWEEKRSGRLRRDSYRYFCLHPFCFSCMRSIAE